MDRFDRIYALHQTLRKARHPVSSDRLRDEMGNCSLATLRDIVRQMRENLYAPIESSRHDGGGYWYAKEDRAPYELPGLWFNTSELLALITCVNLLHEIEPGALEPAIEPLRGKIQSLIEHRHLGVAGQSRRIRILKLAARPHNPVVFRSIAESVLLRRRLTFHYVARRSGEDSLRNVSPQRLTHYRDNWYLDALDHGCATSGAHRPGLIGRRNGLQSGSGYRTANPSSNPTGELAWNIETSSGKPTARKANRRLHHSIISSAWQNSLGRICWTSLLASVKPRP